MSSTVRAAMRSPCAAGTRRACLLQPEKPTHQRRPSPAKDKNIKIKREGNLWLLHLPKSDGSAQMLETLGAPGKARREGPAPPKSAQDRVQPAHAATETPQSSSLGVGMKLSFMQQIGCQRRADPGPFRIETVSAVSWGQRGGH